MRLLIITLSLICIIIFSFYISYNFFNSKSKIQRQTKQIGRYRLDTEKTNLGYYSKNQNLYEQLILVFDEDSFYFNMKVPFIFDSIGYWTVGGNGVEDWNYLFYKSNNKISTQFDQCCDNDSTFYLNSVTPQKDQTAINKIYFKKF